MKARRRKALARILHIALVLVLMLGGLPLAPPTVRAAAGTPGGVDASGLRLWLKADPGSITLGGDGVTEWRDMSSNGNHFKNDGTIEAIRTRPKPKYVPGNAALNFQPAVKFVRSGGSILQDVDGLFAPGEVVKHASLFTVTGGAASMANSAVFTQPLASGNLLAHIPHTSGAAAGKGNVLWDVGESSTRLSAGNAVSPIEYSLWGLHFDADPAAVSESVYQSIVKDGKVQAQTTQSRIPLTGGASAGASIGSAPGGGSGYDGHMGELILFTNPLNATQARQVETYMAIKYGLTLKEGNYVSAGPDPQVVWDAAANLGYSGNLAGIALDQAGALDQRQSRSSVGAAEDQIIVTAKHALTDKQYLVWGDNGSTEQPIPYGSGYLRLARAWKVQNTGGTGQVQVAVPVGKIPRGGVLLTSNHSSFENATALPLTEVTLYGAPYYAADVLLASGTYFTFAEKLPEVQLLSLEIRDGAQNVLSGFHPTQNDGYTAVVPAGTAAVSIAAETGSGVTMNMSLTNYLQPDVKVTAPASVPVVPGVNKLKIELTDGSSNNIYHVDIIQTLAVGPDGQVALNAGSVTASTYQANTNYLPSNTVDGNWEDPESRWSASGQGQWLQFDLGVPHAVTYLKIAFMNAKERLSTFEILESNDPQFTTSTVLLPKRNSRALLSTDSVLQPYVLKKPASARYLRFVGYGNNAAGSSGNWNSLTEMMLYTGTPPVIVEPEEPAGPPQAGDTPEGPPPVLRVMEVSTADQLQSALDGVTPGVEIRLKNGSYEQNGPFVIKNKQGTPALPIRITAEAPGKATIQGNSFLHIENSSYVEVTGLEFNSGIGSPGLDYRDADPGIAGILKGENPATKEIGLYQQVHPGIELYHSSNISIMRNKFALDETRQPYRFNAPDGVGQVWCLTNVEGSCRVGGGDQYNPDLPVYSGDTPHTNPALVTDNGTHRHYIRVEGISSHNRIAYNDIGPKKGFGATITYNGQEGHTVSQYDVIEYNHFHDIGPRVTNGLEVIRLGLSGLSLASGYVTIQYNLFEGLNAEDEIISVKSSDNVIRYNTIRNSFGGIVARHGHRNSFYGNFIIGDGKTPGYSGFRIYGNDHKIYNNYMEGLTTQVIRLDGGTVDAGPDSGTNPTVKWKEGSTDQSAVLNTLPQEKQTELLRGHWRQYNVQVYNNTIVNVGNNTTAFSFGGRTYQPVSAAVYNNLVFSNAGTMFNETAAAQNAPIHERQVYAGNLADGTATLTNIADASRLAAPAIEKKPLQFVRSMDGMIRLSSDSPAIDAAKAPYLPQEDMDGQVRYHKPDAGADEYNRSVPAARGPLTPAQVGPYAGQTAPEGEAGLSSLFVQDGQTLTPSFAPGKTLYYVTVPNQVQHLTLIPTAMTGSSAVTLTVNGTNPDTVMSGQPSRVNNLAEGSNVITLEVSLPSGQNKMYTVIAKRLPGESGSGSSGGSSDPAPMSPAPAQLPEKLPEQKPISELPVQEPLPQFLDAEKHWAGEAIAQAIKKGLVEGYPDGTFKPDAPITRLQFAALLVRLLDLEADAPTAAYADQAEFPGWASDEIAAAVQAGILQGYEDGTLRPNQELNRAEMITMLVRAKKPAKAADPSGLTFSDKADIPEWAKSPAAYAMAEGLIQGKAHNRFAPNEVATRAEAVTLLMRMSDSK